GVRSLSGGLKDVGALPVVTDHEALGRHDLERLEDGGVAGIAVDIDRLVHLADRARAAIPEHAQNGQLGSSRPRKGFLGSWHGEPSVRDGRSVYEAVRNVNEDLRTQGTAAGVPPTSAAGDRGWRAPSSLDLRGLKHAHHVGVRAKRQRVGAL